MTLCECGCGQEVKRGNRFILGHATKGKKFTNEHKMKISKANKGKNLGRKLSDKTKRKIRKSCIGSRGPLGHKQREGHKRKIGEANKGNHHTLGYNHTNEAKRKISIANTRENNSNWQGGISLGIYCPKFNHRIRENVRDKFDRVCFLYGKNEDNNGRRLDVHHVDYNRGQGCNGHSWKLVPLCMTCHSKISKNNKKYWEDLILMRLEVRK